jgi:cytoskeletal protein CcmA (bactofilin family)
MFEHDAPHGGQLDRREEGSAFLIVVLLTLVVAALGTPMLVMSNTAHQIAANERDAERALFAAKAGVNYAYYLYDQGTLVPSSTGTSFDSYASSVATPLSGESFSGTVTDMSATVGRGQLYKIVSNGTYGKSTRQVEVVWEVNPESMKYGYMAFSAATLHNHSGLSGPSFKIQSTIFSNGDVSVPQGLTIDGSIIAAGQTSIDTGSTIKGDIFSNSISNSGAITGNAKTLDAVSSLPSTATTYDRTDSAGNKYAWFAGASTAGTISGSGTVAGTKTSYNVVNGDLFKYSIFRRDGSLTSSPDVNVVEYIAPPQLDYKAMKAEADKNDPTFFTSTAAAMTYLRSKIVTETIDGKTIKTIHAGTTTNPEFLYIEGDFPLVLTGGAGSNTGNNIAADGLDLEGGLYASGDVSIDGPVFNGALQPSPPDWYQVKINGLPYCFPAIIAYPEPSTGTIATWSPSNTPVMTGSASKINMQSGTGFFFFSGLTLSEAETHLHHTANANELIRFIGAELAYKIHNCDYMWFTYDPNVRCTKFLLTGAGTSGVVSYREIR